MSVGESPVEGEEHTDLMWGSFDTGGRHRFAK